MGQSSLVDLKLGCGLVDPELRWHGWRVWSATEPLRVCSVGGRERVLAGLVDCLGGAKVNRCWGVPGNPGMPVNEVVFMKESSTELAGLSDRGER